MTDNISRSVAKTISWRIIASTTTMLIVWIFTGSVTLSLAVGGLEFTSKLLLYYWHERLWNRSEWGRERPLSSRLFALPAYLRTLFIK